MVLRRDVALEAMRNSGTPRAHSSTRTAQRGSNAQPGGRAVSCGTVPGMGLSLPRSKARRRSEQPLCIGMTRRSQDFLRGTFFDDASRIHDRDTIGDLRYDAEIVGDEQQAELQFAAQAVQQIQNLFLHGDVERGGGLIRNQ